MPTSRDSYPEGHTSKHNISFLTDHPQNFRCVALRRRGNFLWITDNNRCDNPATLGNGQQGPGLRITDIGSQINPAGPQSPLDCGKHDVACRQCAINVKRLDAF